MAKSHKDWLTDEQVEKAIEKMKAIINSILNTIIFLLGGKGDIRKEVQEDGICYYGGQG